VRSQDRVHTPIARSAQENACAEHLDVCPSGQGITISSIEFAAGRGLLGVHVAGVDICLEVILAANRAAGEAPEHGDLTDVRE